ncbi:MAG TPA: hypothetical protein VFH40_02405 [Gemmatimonadales bacterium]|nr:hypothetical protein [Gemmatimonadales bacterium]
MTDRHLAVAHLLRSTAQAHHRAFAAGRGEDSDWPNWYARELKAPLSSLLGSTVEPGNLSVALRKLDQEMRRRVPSSDWTLFYADQLLERFGGAKYREEVA